MKHRRNFYVAAAVLLTLAWLPAGVSAASASAGLTSSDVQCVVEPMYSFTPPPDAELYYPNTRMTLGEFAIGELLLASGETLSIGLSSGALAAADGNAIPYAVAFDPPESFDEREAGEAYSVSVEIDAEAFRAAADGTYTAFLRFTVVSRPADKTVWEKETVLTVVKAGDGGDEAVPSTGFLASVPYWWWAAGAAAVAGISLLLHQVIRKRKTRRDVREGSPPEEGQ